jgi:Fe-S cluster assembly iron-binding protein IscA
MLQLTQQAAQHLVRVRGERGFDAEAAARFVSSGTGVGLTFARRPEPDDHVIKTSDIAIYVAPQVAEKLDAATIDVGEKDGRMGLVLKRRRTPAPKARSKAS